VSASARPAARRPARQSPRVLDTGDLLRRGGAQNLGEFTWRVGLVLGAANLLLLGIGLSATNPAAGEQLEPAVRAARVHHLLQPAEPDAGLGVERAPERRSRPRRAAWLGLLVGLGMIWWRDHANVIHPLRLLTRRGAG
jgi:lipopolysaccharide export system permease protein